MGTPADLTGLTAWYFAGDLGLTDGTAVSSWTDKSGNSRTLSQATGVSQPLMQTGGNGINGLPAVLFDGSNDGMKATATTGLLNNVSGATIWWIGKNIDTGTGIDRHAMFISTPTSGTGRAYVRLAVTTRKLAVGGRRLDADAAVTDTGGASAIDTNAHVWIADYNYASA